MTDDTKETLWALLLLLCFALAASAYVFKKGLDKADRTTHELLLKCVIIITSVVPRQLPMQTALAVNTALMALIKAGVYCTEPYRVPFAGKIDAVLFDKTLEPEPEPEPQSEAEIRSPNPNPNPSPNPNPNPKPYIKPEPSPRCSSTRRARSPRTSSCPSR